MKDLEKKAYRQVLFILLGNSNPPTGTSTCQNAPLRLPLSSSNVSLVLFYYRSVVQLNQEEVEQN
jgi:hypothetical protein